MSQPSQPSTLIEVRPGEGGADAAAFADELVAAVAAYLQRRGHTVRPHGSRDRTLVLRTDAPAETVSWLSGTHRVQRIPAGSSARHTSTATLAVLDGLSHPSEEREPELGGREIRVDRYRGRGRGGQRKNKVSTAVRLVDAETGITVTRETGRSQYANLLDAEADLARQLRDRDRRASRSALNQARRSQVVADRSAKTFTHNEQRGEVTTEGRRWRAKDWRRGLLD